MDSRLGFLSVGDHRHGIQHQVHLRRRSELLDSEFQKKNSQDHVNFQRLWSSIHSVASDTLAKKISAADFRVQVMKNARLTKCDQCISHTSKFLRKFSDAEISQDAERIAYILHVYANCQRQPDYQPPPFSKVETRPTKIQNSCNCKQK